VFFRVPLYHGTIVYWDDLQVCCILSKWGADPLCSGRHDGMFVGNALFCKVVYAVYDYE
jgi:hypothetical protein